MKSVASTIITSALIVLIGIMLYRYQPVKATRAYDRRLPEGVIVRCIEGTKWLDVNGAYQQFNPAQKCEVM